MFCCICSLFFCLNADRIWACTPQIADYSDYTDCADFKTSSCEIIAYLSGLKTPPTKEWESLMSNDRSL